VKASVQPSPDCGHGLYAAQTEIDRIDERRHPSRPLEQALSDRVGLCKERRSGRKLQIIGGTEQGERRAVGLTAVCRHVVVEFLESGLANYLDYSRI
jgi:hypothetical protein